MTEARDETGQRPYESAHMTRFARIVVPRFAAPSSQQLRQAAENRIGAGDGARD